MANVENPLAGSAAIETRRVTGGIKAEGGTPSHGRGAVGEGQGGAGGVAALRAWRMGAGL